MSKATRTLQIFAVATLIALGLIATSSFAGPPVANVTFTGLVTCAHCVAAPPQHGFTPLSWAQYSVKQGDNIVLVSSENTYKLEGDNDQLLNYLEDKATVTGNLDGNTIFVSSIRHPSRSE